MVYTAKTKTMLHVIGFFIALISLHKLSAEPTRTIESDQSSSQDQTTPITTTHNKQRTSGKKKIVHQVKKRHHGAHQRVHSVKKKQPLKKTGQHKKHRAAKNTTQQSGVNKDETASKNKRVLKEVRHNIIASAKKFLDNPYVHEKKIVDVKTKKTKHRRGQHIDCSELVQRSYANNKLSIPRTACMQFSKCIKIKDHIEERLKPADLIFTAPAKNPHHINHVMMYMGNGILIESTGAHGKVRIIPIQRRSTKTLSQLPYGKRSGKYVYYYGTFFKKKTVEDTTQEQDSCQDDQTLTTSREQV